MFDEYNPIINAIIRKDVEGIKDLILTIPDVNKKFSYHASESNTLLSLILDKKYSESKAEIEVVRILLKAGADPNLILVNRRGNNLPDFHNYFETMDLLMQHRCNPSIFTTYSSLNNIFNWTPLHLAAWNNQKNLIKVLLKHGSDVNSIEGDYGTALHKVCFFQEGERLSTIEVLLEAGANPNLSDSSKLTPLHYIARRYDSKNCPESIDHIIKLFIRYRCDLGARDTANLTPLDYIHDMYKRKKYIDYDKETNKQKQITI